MKKIVITIDGPSGSGKGTTARGVAKLLSIPHIDSGSIYRTMAYYLRTQDIKEEDGEAIKEALEDFHINYSEVGHVLLNDKDVEKEIRSRENSTYAFQYSRSPIVRENATRLQRELLEHGGILDGRDAGSVVAPFADLKIYLDCDVNERTRRRAKQHNITDPKEIEVLRKEILDRDDADMNKGDASLQMMPDSVRVDTSGMTVDEQVDAVYQLALSKMNQ